MGYFYFAGEKRYANNKSLFQEQIRTPVFAVKSTDTPHYGSDLGGLEPQISGFMGPTGRSESAHAGRPTITTTGATNRRIQ